VSALIPPKARDAWRNLSAVLDDLSEAGHQVPCRGRGEWLSQDAEDVAYAAGHCLRCPALNACGQYADAAGEKHGVWAGVDRSAKKTTEEAA